MSHGYFITGTDTGVGKTHVSVGLLQQLARHGQQVAGMKPVASGCQSTPEGLRNDDALRLQAASSRLFDYRRINPYAFEAPVAPHLAAQRTGARIETTVIQTAFQRLTSEVDTVIVEGVGGWLVPISDSATMADLAVLLELPVILVVAIRLGCLNHALLTVAAIQSSGLPLAGWVANRIDPDCLFANENVDSLKKAIAAPLLADIGRADEPGVIDHFQIP